MSLAVWALPSLSAGLHPLITPHVKRRIAFVSVKICLSMPSTYATQAIRIYYP